MSFSHQFILLLLQVTAWPSENPISLSDEHIYDANSNSGQCQPHAPKMNSQKEPPPLSLSSHASPPTARERSRSPSPVAIVKPMSQSPKHQGSYRRQASVGPVMVHAVVPLGRNVSSPLPHAHYYNQQQQINFIKDVKIREDTQVSQNPQIMKRDIEDIEHDDRPFDPNLVCPTCKQQFRIGEIQEYSRHYKICQKQSEEEAFQLDLLRQNV